MNKQHTNRFWGAVLDGLTGAGLFYQPKRPSHRSNCDMEALRSDWIKVGRDIYVATEKTRKQDCSGAR